MKYAIIKCTNGNFAIHSEGFTDLDKAKVNYFQLCASLWNAPDVADASVMIVDDKLRLVNGYCEHITHSEAE